MRYGCIWILFLAAGTAYATEVERLSRPFATRGTTTLRVELPAATVKLEPYRGSTVEVEMSLRCSGDLGSCRRYAEGLALSSRVEGDSLLLGFTASDARGRPTEQWYRWATGFSSWIPMKGHRYPALPKSGWFLTVELRIRYPDSQKLEVFLGEGEMELYGPAEDASVQLQRGSVRVAVALERAAVVDIAARRGRTAIKRPHDQNLMGKRLCWEEGEGEVHLTAQVGKGDITVRLF